ncbi:hypothetical protein JCM6882_005999 [Rhodosporidiobolus microsporus]
MSSAPASYRAAFVTEKGGKFEIKEVSYKKPEDGQVVVKVLASGVCHSDSVVVDQLMPTGLPRCPGHEIAGRIFEVPASEKRWKVGDYVGSGWHGGHCFVCPSCIHGDFVTCQKENINGVFTDGGHAEYATLRTEAIASLPEEIEPAEAAPLLCAGVTTFNSLRNMSLHPGDVVGVQGLGGLGHLGVQFARQMGYKTVALSGSASKKELADKLGAHVYVDGSKEDQAEALQKLGGAKVVVCTAPNPEIIGKLVPGLAPDGQLLILGVTNEVTIPVVPLIMKRLSVRGWPSGTAADSEDTVKFAQTAGVKTMVETFPLEKIQEAYESMMNGKARFRSVITF